MRIKRSVVSAVLAVMMALSAVTSAYAADVTVSAPTEQLPEAAASEDEPDTTGDEQPVLFTEERLLQTALERSEEEQFLAENPELAELGEYVFEGDTLPCSENDPSYHKYIKELIEREDKDAELAGPLTSLAGVRLLAASFYGADDLVHQERFKNVPKSYGIDVSYYQGNIDWNKVKAAGVSFAILRVGFRGYGKAGTLVLDDNFLRYLSGAKAAGLDVGAYFFTQAITTAEAREEADFVYKYIKGTSLELPVYFDMETVTADNGRLDSAGLSISQKTDIVEAFCDRMIYHGYDAGVYSNPQWLTYYLDAARLQAKYPLWLANYTTNTKYAGNFDIWQYGGGYLNGISGLVDLDVRYHLDQAANPQTPAVPANFRVSGAISEEVTLTWDKVDGCSGYEVSKKNSKGAVSVVRMLRGNSLTLDLTSEKCSYYVRAYKYVNLDYVYSSPSKEITLASNVPAEFTNIGRSYYYITLGWDAVKDAVRYYVYMYDEKAGIYQRIDTVEDTRCKVTGLSDAKLYKFKIRALTQNDAGKYTLRASTPETVIGTQGKQITGLKFVTKSKNSITLSWDKTSSKHAGYEVLRYDDAKKSYVIAGTTTGTEYTVTGLTQGKAYKFCVRSYYKNGSQKIVSLKSSPLSCATKCAEPTNFKAVSDASSYTISWGAPSGATGYMIYAAKHGKTPEKLAETSARSYKVTGLAKGTYTVYVRPYIKCSGTRYYGYSSPTLTVVCGKAAPSGLSGSAANTSVTLSWKVSGTASRNEVYLYNASSKTYVRRASLGGSTARYTVAGLSPSTSYKFKVRSTFADGTALESSVITVKTLSAGISVAAPTGIKATTATESTVTVVWNAAGGAASYRVYLYNAGTGSYALKGTVTKETFTFKGLKQSTMYKMKVTAVSASGSTRSSSIYNITPKPVAPKLSLSSKTETTAALKWNASPLCSKYYIYKLDPLENTFVKIATVNGTSYTVKGLAKGTRNIFKIKAVAVTNAANFNSLFSAQLSVLTRGLVYYPSCSDSCQTLYQAFDELGIEKTYSFQEKIAIANAIKGYEGTAEQNYSMLDTLKKGKLIKPQS